MTSTLRREERKFLNSGRESFPSPFLSKSRNSFFKPEWQDFEDIILAGDEVLERISKNTFAYSWCCQTIWAVLMLVSKQICESYSDRKSRRSVGLPAPVSTWYLEFHWVDEESTAFYLPRSTKRARFQYFKKNFCVCVSAKC